MKKVCFFGTRLWSKRLADLVNRYGDSSVQASSATLTFFSFFRCLPALLRADTMVRVGFRPGVRSFRGIVFDLLWLLLVFIKPQVRQIYYWIGTDVQRIVQTLELKQSLLTEYFVSKSRSTALHLAAAPWLVEELSCAGFRAKSVLFPSPVSFPVELLPLPGKFSVLTYIPEKRHEFYGSRMIYEAAKQLPDIDFYVVAGTGRWQPEVLTNLYFLGWQNNMSHLYMDSTVVVRMVPHDALGGTVREGLAYGRHVIYSYEHPYTETVSFGNSEKLIHTLESLFSRMNEGRLSLNYCGQEYAKKHFDEDRLTRNLIDEL